IPVVAQYRLSDGSLTTRFPMGKTLDDAQPVVEKMPGWQPHQRDQPDGDDR
ncbi:hypothetical protein H6B10_17615, partial [Gemmiger formicilis]|nr:hypothetical protein [Gemmiger formicilis]